MREIDIGGSAWEVKGFWPWVPIKGTSMELGQELLGVTDWLPATIPGGVHYDLYRAGLIAHSYKDLNSLQCEWVENRWWLYRTEVSRPEQTGERIELVFKGLDYEAVVYVGGKLLGEHKGMYHEAAFDVTALLEERATLEIAVLLKHAPDEMAQIGKTSETFTQKSRFNYKWDFSTRLVNLGIWDDVVLRIHECNSIGEVYLHTDADVDTDSDSVTAARGGRTEGAGGEGKGRIRLGVEIEQIATAAGTEAQANLRLIARCYDPQGKLAAERETEARIGGEVVLELEIPQAQLWYPNGYGAQPLYEVRLLLQADGVTVDERAYRTGIRKLEYVANEGAPADALPYTVKINGKRIYIRGVNMTPIDHLYGNVTDGQYAWAVRLMEEGNVNLVRVWGGGLIEKTRLYELCDENGILVWQEFIQSSSGVDNIPSQRPEFIELLERSARAALASRRNHVSLVVWSGGNELMSEPNKPSDLTDGNLALLRDLVRKYDPNRLFLPTSASGPVEYITEEKGLGHDVHGHWKYQGNPRHYELYGDNDNLFHSEFGVDGLSRIKSLHKFLGEAHREPVSMKTSMVWRHHGEWWDTLERDEEVFGPMKTLADFSDCSQWMQAEGLRFILEANRRRKFNNSGSIIWQLNEPWPNVSCTNLVDYYGEPKMAYYWMKQAFAPLHVSLDYRKLDYGKGEPFRHSLYVHACEAGIPVAVTVEVLDVQGTVHHVARYEGTTANERALRIGELDFHMPDTNDGLVLVRVRCETERCDFLQQPPSVYFFSISDGPLYAGALTFARNAKTAVRRHGEWRYAEGLATAEFVIANEGTAAALHVHAEELTDLYWMDTDDQYFTLLPGETRGVSVRCVPKTGGGFLAEEVAAAQASDTLPQIRFRSFLEEPTTDYERNDGQ